MLEKDVYGKRNAPFVFFDDALQHFNFALVQRRKKLFQHILNFPTPFKTGRRGIAIPPGARLLFMRSLCISGFGITNAMAYGFICKASVILFTSKSFSNVTFKNI